MEGLLVIILCHRLVARLRYATCLAHAVITHHCPPLLYTNFLFFLTPFVFDYLTLFIYRFSIIRRRMVSFNLLPLLPPFFYNLYLTFPYLPQAMYSPKYNGNTGFGDIAIIQLTQAVSQRITPVATASTNTSWVGITSVTAVGWGGTGVNEEGELIVPNTLMYATVGVIPPAQCKALHKENFKGNLPRDHMCLGLSTDPATNACYGDAGAPYLLMRNGQAPLVVAIASYESPNYDCGFSENNINWATNVTYYKTWIDSTLKLHKLK